MSVTQAPNGTWRSQFRTPAGKVTGKRGFPTKAAAVAWETENNHKIATGDYVAPSLGKATVGELADAWLTRKEALTKPSHYRSLVSSWRTHVGPRWASVPVADIDALAIETWIATMTRAGSSASVVIRAHGILSGILGDAVKGRRISGNPAKGLPLPRKTAKRHVYLTAEDVARLADEAGRHGTLVLTLAYTGIRWGEAIALRVRDVEFLRRRLAVSENAVQLSVDHALGTTKSGKPRSVPVPSFVLDELAQQVAGKAPGELVFGEGVDGYLPRPKSDGGWFSAAVKRAGVDPTLTPHALRHTCASLTIAAGANVLALQRMLGHTSAKMTLDTYADLFDEDLERVADALQARYGPGGAGASEAPGQ